MDKVHTLSLSAWTPSANLPPIALTYYQMPNAVHDVLVQWCHERVRRDAQRLSIVLRGLPELLAAFVPDVAFMRHEYVVEAQAHRLRLFFLGHRRHDTALQQRIETAFALWLGLHYPQKSAELRAAIAASVHEIGSWQQVSVSTQLQAHEGACPLPTDRWLLDALTAHAAQALNGQWIEFRSGVRKQLILQTAQASPVNGLELVAFPPERDAQKPAFFWSEVITLTAATAPERTGVQVLARASVRNWGPLRRSAGYAASSRKMDLFIPQVDANPDDTPRYHHATLRFHPVLVTDAPQKTTLTACWKHKEDARLLTLMQLLAGSEITQNSDHIAPISHEYGGLWALPRLGYHHGDTYLPGATGIGWGDRHDICTSLDRFLAGIQLQRIEPLTRYSKQLRIDKPFEQIKEPNFIARRDAIARTLVQLNNPTRTLDVWVFHQHDETPSRVLAELQGFLGTPTHEHSSHATHWLQWEGEGALSIRVIAAASDVLAMRLPPIEISAEEQAQYSREQLSQIRHAKRLERNQQALAAMSAYVQRLRPDGQSIACALLEMNKSLMDDAWHDPYALAKYALAQQRVLTQVILQDENPSEDKYLPSIRDCFRMLGVVPLTDEPLPLAPAALTVVQLNHDVVSGEQRASQAFPLATRVRHTLLECALPRANGEPEWLPYAEAVLRVLSGHYGKFARTRNADTERQYAHFFAETLTQIDSLGPCLVMLEAETLAHKWPALLNNQLCFDKITLANQTVTPQTLPNTRLIRISSDTKKIPMHYHEGPQKDVSGFFYWPKAQRTFFALRAHSLSAKKFKINAVRSRHSLVPQEGRVNGIRQLVPLHELCVLLCQPHDAPAQLALMSHRLRGIHTQFYDETSLPFPLHELRLLARSVMFGDGE